MKAYTINAEQEGRPNGHPLGMGRRRPVPRGLGNRYHFFIPGSRRKSKHYTASRRTNFGQRFDPYEADCIRQVIRPMPDSARRRPI